MSHWVGVSRYIHWHSTFSEPLGGCFSLYTLTFHLQWVTWWGFFAIYTDISPSVSHWVGVSRYIHWHCNFSEPLGGCFSLYTLTFDLHWATGWLFLAIYTDISPSVSHWVGVSHYIHWHSTFSESLGGCFSLYTLTFDLHWATGCVFLAIYTDISPSVSHWVGVYRYIHWHFTFSESLGGGFRYIHRHCNFSESLGGCFSLHTLTFHVQWVTGWVFLAIYTDIWPSLSHWVGVSRYIHWHFTFSVSLGGCFSLYKLTFDLHWVTGWGFLSIYTDISPSVSHWVGVSRYIHWHSTFSESLGGCFSLYTLIFHLQLVTGWGFLAIYTDISPSVSHLVGVFAIYTDIATSVSHWVGVSHYIHWHSTFSEPLGGCFSLYTLTFHLQLVTGWGFIAIYTDISPSVSHLVGVFAIYTDIATSVSHWVGVSHYIHWHSTFSEPLGGCFSLYTLTFHLQWVTGWRFLAIYTDISPAVSHCVGVSLYIHWHFTFSESLGGGFTLYTLTYHF